MSADDTPVRQYPRGDALGDGRFELDTSRPIRKLPWWAFGELRYSLRLKPECREEYAP